MTEQYKNNLLKALATQNASDKDTKTVMEFAEQIAESKSHDDFVQKELERENSEKIKCVVIQRFENDSFIGGYTQAADDLNVLIDEIKEASEVGTKWTLELIEMTVKEYENLLDFEGY